MAVVADRTDRVIDRISQGILVLASAAFVMGAMAAGSDPEQLSIDDFEHASVGQFPDGWDWREDDGGGDRPYAVAEENGNRYLAARDAGQSVIVGRKITVDLDRYPYLAFRWRVHRIPEGGDERHGESGDSAAAVYVVYRKSMGIIPLTVKFVWSSTLPVGTALQRSGVGRPWIIVADSGDAGLGEWRTHVFDVRAAWRETFGGKMPRRVIAVGVLSDANATRTQAHADYDDIRFLARADAGSGIRQVVDAD